jgi:hypothetical protein
MDAVAHKALCVIFRLHPKDVTGKFLIGDVGMLPLPLKIHLLKLVRQKRIQHLPRGKMDFG